MNKLSVIVILTIMLCACGKNEPSGESSNPSSASKGDSVRILSQSPSLEESLTVGQKVKLSVEVEYELNTGSSGDVTLVVQDASNNTVANELYPIRKGMHKETLEAEVTVPDTRALVLFTPLTPQGNSRTTVVESISYKVEKAGPLKEK